MQDAVAHVNGEIRDAVVGLDAADQRVLDAELCALDGTDAKGRLGANAILGVSLAAAKAVADECGMPLYRYVGGTNAHVLPVPMMNVLNGGVHADNNVDLQEFMIVPVGAVSFGEGLRWGAETYHALKALLKSAGSRPASATKAASPRPAVERRRAEAARRGDRARGLQARRRDRARARPGRDRVLRRRHLRAARRRPQPRPADMVGYFATLCDRYPIVSIEDGMAEDDWDGWAALTKQLGGRVQLVGDDLFVTNPERLRAASTPAWPTRSSSR